MSKFACEHGVTLDKICGRCAGLQKKGDTMQQDEVFEDSNAVSPAYAAASTTGPTATDDLSLADEDITVDPEAPAFAFPKPPSETGNPYLMRLRRGTKGLKTVTTDDHKAIRYLMAHIQIEVLSDKTGKSAKREGAKDNPVGYDQATTIPLGASNRAADILRAGLKRPLPSRQTHRTIGNALWDALRGEPLVKIYLQWRARCGNCSVKGGAQFQLVGERNFKQLSDGSHDHVWTCPRCGGEVSANWQPTIYLPA